MGPRRRRRGRLGFIALSPPRKVRASMGPRRRRRGRGRVVFGNITLTNSLQWGHVVVDVEGLTSRGWGCVRRCGCFNGATSSSTLKGTGDRLSTTTPAPQLQWGHVVVDVEGAGQVPVPAGIPAASMGPRRRRRGRVIAAAPDMLEALASMGPRRRRRGRSSTKRSRGSRPDRRFNGATSSSTWKAPPLKYSPPQTWPLQWGHVVVDVEGKFNTLENNAAVVAASMGPRRRRRGRSGLRFLAKASRRFNGATSSSTWKDVDRVMTDFDRLLASMGPRRRRRGRRCPCVDGAHVPCEASMGPRRRRRGRDDVGQRPDPPG